MPKAAKIQYFNDVISDAALDDVIKSYNDAKNFLSNNNITISTVTLDCKQYAGVYVKNFAKYVALSMQGIISVKYGERDDIATNRAIIEIKEKKKKSKRAFYNQATILMRPSNNPARNHMNIKVFKNGSFHITGCKDMDDFNNVTRELMTILAAGHTRKRRNGSLCHVPFIDNVKKIGIYNVRIRMINSNFKRDHKIDRDTLKQILFKYHNKNSTDADIGHVICKYKSTSGHACVDIKYQYDENNRVSIFVFQTGAVIITGAKDLLQVIMAYKYINAILDRYYDQICIKQIDINKMHKAMVDYFNKRAQCDNS